jgi:hypothetical protein
MGRYVSGSRKRLFADLIADHAADSSSAHSTQYPASGDDSAGHATHSRSYGGALLAMAQAIPRRAAGGSQCHNAHRTQSN